MRLIFIDGGPAAGKNTLGELIIKQLHERDEEAVLLDLDTYVERYNPEWIWGSGQQKEADQQKARRDIAKDVDAHLRRGDTVIVIGERFLSKDDVSRFMERMTTKINAQLFHLNIPFELREQRLHQRGPHSLIDLKKDQSDRDAIQNWPGYVYGNVHAPEIDAKQMVKLIEKGEGEL